MKRKIRMNPVRCFIHLCVIFTTLNAIPTGWSQTTSAENIIKRYIHAVGGHALKDIISESSTGTLLRGRIGKIPFEIDYLAPGKWRWRQTFAWGDGVCYGFDGIEAWVHDTKSVVEMDPHQRLDLQLMLDPQAPLKLREWFSRMKMKGMETLGEKEVVRVLASTAEGSETELAFDCETGLLLRAGNVRFEDYRDVDNVKRPFKIILGEDRGEEHLQMIMEFSETRHDIDIDDSLFLPPASGLPFVDAPLYKRRDLVRQGTDALDACVGRYRHPERPDIIYTVTRQRNHLMFQATGWPQKYEMMPESETDYYFQFLGWDFHFIKDESGRVTSLRIEANIPILAQRIEP